MMDPQSSDVVYQLRAQLSTAQNHVAQLQQEKLEMEADFEHKRTKIKELYFAKETALREHNMRLLEAGQQISSMESTISSLKEEVENIKMIAAVSENTKEEAVKDLDKHHQEEIESLRCVLRDSMEEQRSELVAQFERERRRWESEKANMELILKEEREKNCSKSQERLDAENLLKLHDSEISMKKAQLEAETLKAVVLPLETEIEELKEKVKLTTKLLSENDTTQEHVAGDAIDIQAKSLLSNRTEGETTTDFNSNSCLSTTTPVRTPSDDGSFSQFQSYPSNNAQPSPTPESVSTTLTEFQDTISISSVSSLPTPTEMVPEERLKSQRVLSAPHLPQLVVENQVGNSKEPDTELERALEKERRMRLDVEEAVAHASEEAQKQISDLKKQLADLESRLEEDKSWRKEKEIEDDQRLAHLQKGREKFHADFLQTKKEVDRLKSFHEKHRIDLSKELVLPSNLEGLSSQVRIHRDAVLVARVEKSVVQTRLQSQLSFLQDRLTAEQNAKEQLETTLLAELQEAKKKLSSQHDLEAKLNKESSAKRDLLSQAERDKILMASYRIKSEERRKELEEKLKAETSLREELANKLLEAKNQISSLQDALKTSEQVQQDFVRLSQSLQMELEERRVEESDEHPDQLSVTNPPPSPDVSRTSSSPLQSSNHG